MTSEQFIDIDGVRLRYCRTGEGRPGPLVLALAPCHVAPRRPSGLLRMLQAVDDLAPGLAIENVCVGESSDVPLDFFAADGSLTQGTARLFAAVFDRLGVDLHDCVVFSHCGGCWVASQLVADLRLKPRLTVLSSAPPLSQGMRARVDALYTKHPGGLWQYTPEQYRVFQPWASDADIARANERAVRLCPQRTVEIIPWDTFRYFGGAPARAGRIAILHPEHDLFSLESRQRLAEELGARLHVVPGAWHDPDEDSHPAWMALFRQELIEALAQPRTAVRMPGSA